jgi:ABC-type dipeptide/oligopeptide/nickel transport system permease component
MQALQRSTRLVRPRFWPTLGTLALSFVPAIVVAAIIGYIPRIFESSAQLSAIVTMAAIVVLQPYFAAVVALIYVDLRIRHENLPYSAHFVRGHL